MPWVTEQEQQDLVDKVKDMRDWIDKKMDEQAKLTLMDDPAFTMEQVDKEMAKVTKLAKKIFGKKKPKEDKKKVIKADEDEKEEKASDAGEEAKEEKVQDDSTS